MYDYKLDNCGPVYLTIGDGGNAEGLSRTFVDETNPATNATYCEGLKTNGGKYPNQAAAAGISWAPEFQRIVSTSYCSYGCLYRPLTLRILVFRLN